MNHFDSNFNLSICILRWNVSDHRLYFSFINIFVKIPKYRVMGVRHYRLVRHIQNSSGFGIIEVMVAVGVIGFLLFSTISTQVQLKKQQVQSADLVSLNLFKGNLAMVIRNDPSWANTLEANSSSGLLVGATLLKFNGGMDCLKNSTACGASASKFALIDSGGNVIYDGTNAAAGLNLNGTSCSSNCPITYTLQWTAVCPPPGGCIASQVNIEAVFVPQSPELGPINPVRYSLSPAMVRNVH